MGPETLAQVLRPLQNLLKKQSNPNLLVGLDISDDAAVYKISDQTAIIATVDFFTPVVDDPYHFGAIAAANAMSDVYAMGGEVFLALNICGFPADLPTHVISEILRGGAEKVAEADGIVAGGHTIIDSEPKYGLSVLGRIHPDKIITKAGAKAGDALILTKALGTGVITTALKEGKAGARDLELAVDSMKTLNRYAARILNMVHISACTDITGYSLIGHSFEMAEKSRVGIQLYSKRIPLLAGSSGYAAKNFFPGGCQRNQTFYEKQTHFDSGISDPIKRLLFTPETSGGLLAAVSIDRLDELSRLFTQEKQPFWVVGEVIAGAGIEVLND